MSHIQNLVTILLPQTLTLGIFSHCHNSSVDCARELLKPPRDGKSFVVYWRKKLKSWMSRYFVCWHLGTMFMHILFTLG